MAKDKDLVAVAIPIYKQQPDASELMALGQCIHILRNYPIIFFCPVSLDTTVYEAACAGKVPFAKVPFQDHYFQSIAGYNQLMLSPEFYKHFFTVQYILIHQLDAYVFRDELTYWCHRNYDYIGAPNIPHGNNPGEIRFLRGYAKLIVTANRIFKTNRSISNVGNGGLSLRKTKSCYWLLRLLHGKVKAWGTNNEDGFFKYWGNILHPLFKLPADEVALHFSIEDKPAASLSKLGGKLPFGCHGFEQYEPEVWKRYMDFTCLKVKQMNGN
jgi:hypothetical protein